jgi:hypothetical protein
VSAEARWLPWLKINPHAADVRTFERVWVPAADLLAILDEHGVDLARKALVATLDAAAPLAGGRDDQGGHGDE